MERQGTLFSGCANSRKKAKNKVELPDFDFLNRSVGHLVKLRRNNPFLYCKAFGAAIQEVKKQLERERAGLFAKNLELVWPVISWRERLIGPLTF